jgi:truncated hemoglobin YjbI
MKEISLSKKQLQEIYSTLGEDSLRVIVRDFYGRMEKDILIGFFFQGKDLDLISERQLSFLLRAMGATSSYSGKAPAQAHDALPPILAGHFDRRLRILEETLASHGVKSALISTWITFEESFRESIVE